MANYEPRRKFITDKDFWFTNGGNTGDAWDGMSCASSAAWVTTGVDLGANVIFMNTPVHVFWNVSVNFSQLSTCTLATGSGSISYPGARAFLEIQDSADNVNYTTIISIPMFNPSSMVSTVSIITAATINALDVGLGSVDRYVRLRWNALTATDPLTLKAWLRMGLMK